MSEKLNFAIDGEFLTNIARDWFWNMNKSYKKQWQGSPVRAESGRASAQDAGKSGS